MTDPRTIAGPDVPIGIGMVVPYDMALDAEMWRWAPADVTLHFTRTPYSPLPVSLEMARTVSDGDAVHQAVRDLVPVAPAVVGYGCTSGSFVDGVDGERRLADRMVAAGAPIAITTSGALLTALAALGAHTVSVATPYDPAVTDRLAAFLDEAGHAVAGSAHLGLDADIWRVPYARTAQLVLDADDAAADAVFVSCTNLPTYDVIAPLEAMLDKPVLTANQVTMWAALRACGRTIDGAGQRLADPLVAQ